MVDAAVRCTLDAGRHRTVETIKRLRLWDAGRCGAADAVARQTL